jgi:hypothetical protein
MKYFSNPIRLIQARSRDGRKQGLCAALAFLLGSASAASAANRPRAPFPAFMVDGTIVYAEYITASNRPPSLFKFTVHVDGCRWRIHCEPEDKSAYDYQEAYHDGQYTYFLHSIKNVVDELVRRTGERKADNVANALIYEGQVFRNGLAHVIGPIWLMLCSGCYWEHLRGDVVEPVITFTPKGLRNYSLGPREGIVGYSPVFERAAWRQSDKPPYLPEFVAFLNLAGEGPRQTNSVLRVLESTNFYGIIVPVAAVLETLWDADQGRNKRSGEVFTAYTLKVTSVRPGFPMDSPPKLPGRTTIADFRFIEPDVMRFDGTNWPSVQAATNSSAFERQRRVKKQMLSTMAPTAPSRRAGMALLIAFASLSAIFLFLVLRGRTR